MYNLDMQVDENYSLLKCLPKCTKEKELAVED